MKAEFQSAAAPLPGGPIVGIDLGTTNSLVAFVRSGTPDVLSSRDGRRLVPSIVSFEGGRPTRVGETARARKVLDPRHTVFSVKRLLGRSFDDLKEVARGLPYEILPPAPGTADGLVRIGMDRQTFTAVEISAMILRELKARAEQALGQPVSRAVITVPAYFNDSQRQATRAAGRLAGWDVLRIINEPTAASLAYGLQKKRDGLIAVYDLGGGTFDVSILKLRSGIFEVLATNGDTALGGDDLDQAIFREEHSGLARVFGKDPLGDAELHAAALHAAESLKVAFSTGEHGEFLVEQAGSRYARPWTRAEFEAAVVPTLERTRGPCLRALEDAGLKASDLTDVVLVGGPTRLPVVQRVAREIFGREPNTSLHPDEVVAVGAAIQADILAGNNKEFLLLDVVPLSLGIETYGGLMSVLIPRNTRVPTVARELFTTFVDNQTGVDVHVFQGERERVEDNRSLARFKLKGLQPAPAGAPRVEVTFLVDADGILQVSARDQRTLAETTVEVRPSYGLTDDEVTRMIGESMDHAEEDVFFRRIVEARNKHEPTLRAAEKKLPDARRLLPREDVARIEKAMGRLAEALRNDDLNEIGRAAEGLNTATIRLAELLVKEALLPHA